VTTSCDLTANAELSACAIARRASDGTWSNLDGGLSITNGAQSSIAYEIVEGSDKNIYVTGRFDEAGGVTACHVAYWDGNNWNDMDQGIEAIGDKHTIAEAPNGNWYIGGTFDTAGSISACNIATFDGNEWSALADGLDNTVQAIALISNGTLYAGGKFTQTEGGTALDRIGQWDGVAWQSLGTPAFDDDVISIVTDSNNDLFVGGEYGTLSGSAASGIGKWDDSSSAWQQIGTLSRWGPSVQAQAQDFNIGPDEELYVFGYFEWAGTITSPCQVKARNVAQFNRSQWQAMGDGSGSTVNDGILDSFIDSDGIVYMAGQFQKLGTGTRKVESGFAKWEGSVWIPFDIKIPNSPRDGLSILKASDNSIYFGWSLGGTASTSGVTTITNSGTAKAYPQIVASGPGQLYVLRNNTTGQEINFDLYINSGETVTLDLTTGAKTFKSTFRGNIVNNVLPTSELSTWHLLPGANNISLFIDGGSAAAEITWTERYWSLDGKA
jgi:hypothetical protein